MIITALMTDAAVLAELGQRIERVRLERNVTQAELAREAGISRRTLVRLEQGEHGVGAATLVRVIRALGLLEQFDLLVPEPLPSPIEQLRLDGRRRRRASRARDHDAGARWTWGEPSPDGAPAKADG
jgi:putative transcriptional regulator